LLAEAPLWRLTRGKLQRAARSAAPRLVDEVCREPTAEKDRLEALPSIRRGFPAFRKLRATVPHDERQHPPVDRNLVPHVGMIAVHGLAGRRGVRVTRIEGSGIGHHRAANHKAALLDDFDRP
jgi:hypothetical protein